MLQRAERPAWRAQADKACFAEGRVRPSASLRELGSIDGPGLCGLDRPLKVSALKDGALPLDKAVVLDCPMVAAVEDWLDTVVQPAAQARFGVAVAELDVFGGYSCRSVDNLAGQKLSEHAFANALDVSGFTLADGRKVVIVRDWKRDGTQESAFLHEATPAPAGPSPPCSVRGRTCSITTISISIWRCTGAPIPARAAIASRPPPRT